MTTEEKTDAASLHRWTLCYDRFGGKISTIANLKLSDIKETVTSARDAGNNIPIHANAKAWMLKHVVASINKDGADKPPLADKVVITDNKV